jgi:hypothetical protein
MATVTDNFSGTLGNWTNPIVNMSTMQIVTGTLQTVTSGATSGISYSATTPANDHYTQFRISVLGGNGSYVFAAVRCQVALDQFYFMQVTNSTGGGLPATCTIMLRKWDNGGTADYDTDTAAIAAGDIIKCSIQGTSIKGYINGLEVLSGTTDTAFASGRWAILARENVGTAADLQIDDFTGSDEFGSPTLSVSGLITIPRRVAM